MLKRWIEPHLNFEDPNWKIRILFEFTDLFRHSGVRAGVPYYASAASTDSYVY